MARIVQKFGGSSVADAERIGLVAERILSVSDGNEVVAVVSAQGKTTDALIAKAASQWQNASGSDYHRELSQLLSCGEQMSAALCTMELLKRGVAAVSLNGWQMGLLTSEEHLSAWPQKLLHQRIENELHKRKVVIVTGFQGINQNGDITTLGRGGSDTTAVALSHYLSADRCQIFTDVDGVYTDDPNKNPAAQKLQTVTYDQMLHMAQHGAKVLHDRCVKLAREYQIPIEVRSTFSDVEGTIVFG